MRVVFRVDASVAIGTGHVFRCLTLARALQQRGADCRFVCADLPGNMADALRQQGFAVHVLARDPGISPDDGGCGPVHLHWLQTDQQHDAYQTLDTLAQDGLEYPDWWVVDHYGLDADWEREVKGRSHLAVIDDLADRDHFCDLLTDPGMLRQEQDYAGRVSVTTPLLIGPRFALLRDEFRQWRVHSLARRLHARLRHVLVFMGGMDPAGSTRNVLQSLAQPDLREALQVTAVMGQQAPSLAEVKACMEKLPTHWQLLTQVSDMARIMSECDLAIGACGTTVWERACLGLPSICAVLAENQVVVGEHLQAAGIAHVVQGVSGLGEPLQTLLRGLLQQPNELNRLSEQSARCTDGLGAQRMSELMYVVYQSRGQSGEPFIERPAP